MQISAPITPRFGMLILEKEWDKSSQDVGISGEEQAGRVKAYQKLEKKEAKLSKEFGEKFSQLESTLGIDLIIETDIRTNRDAFRVKAVRRSDGVLLSVSKPKVLDAKLKTNDLSRSIGKAIRGLTSGLINDLNNAK